MLLGRAPPDDQHGQGHFMRGGSMPQSPASPLAAALARYPSLDPKAVMAVAAQEGLGGGIGDQGTSFGPFQLHYGGAYPASAPRGAQASQAWAWSPAGLGYALSRIASVAGGLHGGQAVSNIVSRFERPADIPGEIARALAGYPGAQAGGGAMGSVQPGAAAPSTNPHLLQVLLATRAAVGLGAPGQALTRALQARTAAPIQAAWGTPGGATVGGKAGQGQSGLPPLRSVGGVQVDSAIAPTVAQLISRFGVTPTSGYRSAAHNAEVGGATHSDHLSGDAVDFSGSPQALAALYAYAQGKFPYVEPMAQAKDHVHISLRRP